MIRAFQNQADMTTLKGNDDHRVFSCEWDRENHVTKLQINPCRIAYLCISGDVGKETPIQAGNANNNSNVN